MNTPPRLIGFASWQGPVVAELWGRNVWRVKVNGKDDPVMTRNITGLYSDRLVYGGPGDGYYGFSVLDDLAKQMNGRFTYYGPPVTIPPDSAS
jgi:hypothetical protein